MEPNVDINGGNEPGFIQSRRTFEHNGRTIEEIEYKHASRFHRKKDAGITLSLAWAVFPFDKMILEDGYPNPIFYLPLNRPKDEVRKDIQESFDLYYSGVPGQRKYDLMYQGFKPKNK